MGRQVSVAEAAERLGVTPHRVRQRIEDGSLPAERVGNRWSLDESDLLPLLEGRRVGRPLSDRSAWAILDLADSSSQAMEALGRLAASERRRAQQRLSALLTRARDTDDVSDVARVLREMLTNRAARHVLRANDRDLPDLRADDRLILSGLSDQHAEIAGGDVVEGYVSHADATKLGRDYLLTPAIDRASRQRANVILHYTDRSVPSPAPLLLVAADLADHRSPREESRAVEILNSLPSQP